MLQTWTNSYCMQVQTMLTGQTPVFVPEQSKGGRNDNNSIPNNSHFLVVKGGPEVLSSFLGIMVTLKGLDSRSVTIGGV